MFFELTDEQKAIKQLAKDFAENRLSALVKDEEQHLYRKEILREMGELGFFGTVMPSDYGGNEAGFLATVLTIEEMARISPSYCMAITGQTTGPGSSILREGTKEQKDKYLPGLISGEIMGFFALTEPDAGSDLLSIKMTAVEQNDSYVLNGVKTWITNAPIADAGIVFAYTDREKGRKGISCFIVDLRETRGIQISPIVKMGLLSLQTGEMTFDDIRIPKDSLLGDRGKGYRMLMEMLGETRIGPAARAVGLSGACLDDCVRYAKQRKQYGQPIAEFQMIQDQLAEMHVEHEAAKMLVYQAAANMDRGRRDIAEVATAKYFAAESSVRAADMALRIWSSYGYSMDSPIPRYIRDSRAFPITEGTPNIQKIIIARSLLRD